MMDKLYTVSEAAKILNITPRTLRRWCKNGFAYALRTPTNHRRFTLSEVERLAGIDHSAQDNTVTAS